jgi:hypothetical protein
MTPVNFGRMPLLPIPASVVAGRVGIQTDRPVAAVAIATVTIRRNSRNGWNGWNCNGRNRRNGHDRIRSDRSHSDAVAISAVAISAIAVSVGRRIIIIKGLYVSRGNCADRSVHYGTPGRVWIRIRHGSSTR